MRAIILAGGKGTRLLPQTETIPKCLLTVGDKAILDYQLDTLKACGITEIGIVIGHYGEAIKEHVAGRDDLSITFIDNNEYDTSNSAHSLYLSKDYAKADPEGFLVLNSDLIFNKNHLDNLLKSPHKDAIIVHPTVTDSDMCNVRMNDEQILEMSKELPAESCSAEAIGPIKFSQSGGAQFLDRLVGHKNNWVFYVLSEFAQEYPFYGVPDQDYRWAEIDTPEDLEEATKRFYSPANN